LARKILLADDSVTAQNMGRKILADAGYEVIAVNNGSAALKKIAELKPDLVILDVYMPGYSGLEVCQRLKESPETARIPVLLTVGKLEPFKPEESHRVRAEGYIVKPFEASELLSALSKLEDKIVPRPEPSKPGRFARAMAVADETGRIGRGEPANENGWKSRIGFPQPKTEAEQKEEEKLEGQSTYNPTNRDLRTEVESFEEKAEARRKAEAERAQAETSVDVAALAPAGFPKDVTPEELAAITAAAAQIQMAGAIAGEPQTSDQINRATNESAAGEVKHRRRKDDRPIDDLPTDNQRVEETRQDEPVTMAAAAEPTVASDAPRWAAVSVALEGDEAAISLEQEMQKTYASFAAEDSGATNTPERSAAPDESFSAPTDVTVETPVAAISNPEPEFAQPEPVLASNSAEPDSVPTTSPDVVAEPAVSASTETDVEQPQEHPEISATFESIVPNQEPAPSVFENRVAEENPPVPTSWQLLEADVATIEASTAHNTGLEPAVNEQHSEPEPQLDTETVKSTAAAWASWRQVRDTGRGSEETETHPTGFEVPESVPEETNAKAVAAGAEQFVEAATAAADSSRNPSDVASIVDSVLADLRPKLMEEISRKMAEKK
jgi:CheY-like chemotaxis protein